jgi:hypothetical protein
MHLFVQSHFWNQGPGQALRDGLMNAQNTCPWCGMSDGGALTSAFSLLTGCRELLTRMSVFRLVRIAFIASMGYLWKLPKAELNHF